MASNHFLRRALRKILSRSDQQQPSLHQRRLFLENLEDRCLLAADICITPHFSPIAPPDDYQDHFHDAAAIPVFVDGFFQDGDVNADFPYGKENTFKLASNPTATKTIYLDYDGHHSVNNQWGHDLVFPAFDRNGDTSSFSDSELSEIQKQFIEVVETFYHLMSTLLPWILVLTL